MFSLLAEKNSNTILNKIRQSFEGTSIKGMIFIHLVNLDIGLVKQNLRLLGNIWITGEYQN